LDGVVIVVLVVLLLAAGALLARSLRGMRRARTRFQILREIADASERGTSLTETLEAVGDILVPGFADFCMIDLISGDRIERVSVKVAQPGGEGARQGLAGRRPSLPRRMVVDEGSASIEPRFFEKMSEADLRELAHDEEDLRFLRGLGVRSSINVALRARGKLTGVLTLGVAWSGRRYRRDHADFARVLAGRVALTLDNAGLFSDLERAELVRAEIAETLQRGLLPSPLPHIPGWSAAAVYRPAGAENEVGGDFYDAFPVAGGWMLVIGDVTGRGARAASVTAQARYTLRTAAGLTGDPLVALATLNRALLSRGDAALCSVAAVALPHEPMHPVRIAVAGHPPPLLVADGSVEEAAGAGPVLGAFADAHWAIDHAMVAPGQQLVLVTDGVAEASGAEGRFGEERLWAGLLEAAGPGAAVQGLERALQTFTEGKLDDDVAILTIAPSPTGTGWGMHQESRVLVERLFDAFNRRDEEQIVALCDEEMEFFPVTAEAAGRVAPYVGIEGLRDYLDDVAALWEELLIRPSEVEWRDGALLVSGRVFLRSREFGIRDMAAGWIWELRDDRFVRGEVFADPELAARRFSEAYAA
jgi:serine phosphatase RsbU (regulator of sigma subunit)/ketosteroid isomerase-like protein